jgi:hypothetical protein
VRVRDAVLSIGEDNGHTLHLMQEYAALLGPGPGQHPLTGVDEQRRY